MICVEMLLLQFHGIPSQQSILKKKIKILVSGLEEMNIKDKFPA